jgi:chitin disaccharide deacetylase
MKLIVTADDFGIGLETSKGILEAHLRGPVTATSLMTITGEHAERSIPLLAAAPKLEVGLHLVFTNCGHRPLKAQKSSGMVARDGTFFSNGRLWIQAFRGKIEREAALEEISAQARKFRHLTGRDPAYVDGHHHAHQLPMIREALAELMEKGEIPRVTRVTVEPPSFKKPFSRVGMKRRMAEQLGKGAAEYWKPRDIRHNDFFFGMLSAGQTREEFPWREYLERLPDAGVVEWVVHPGMADETLVGRDDYLAERESELEALTSAAAAKVWEKYRGNLARKSEVFGRGGPIM